MRVIICAQGGVEGGTDRRGRPRWQLGGKAPYLDTPKQLVEIDGEALVHRTVRLLRERGITDIIVTATDDRFIADGARRVELDNPAPVPNGLNCFYATQPLWAEDDRTCIMFGDVFYTDAAIDTITSHSSDDYHVFRRPGPSEVTGCQWDEPFAITFGRHEWTRILKVADELRVKLPRARKPHVWMHLAMMGGLTSFMVGDAVKENVASVPGQTHIDDWTDDIDTPLDWRRFVGRYYRDKLNIVVIVPWAEEDEWRSRSRAFTRAWWESLGVPVIEGEDRTGGRWCNRSAARNDAVRQANELVPEWEVAFLADADTIVLHDQAVAACHLALATDRLVLAFDDYRRMQPNPTRLVLDGRLDMGVVADRRRALQGARAFPHHASGAAAVSRGVWESVGGFDERFTSWGGEDRAFWLACNTLHGEADRVDGAAWHLYHDRAVDKDRNLPEYHSNVSLGMRYKAAAGVKHKAGVLPALERVHDPDPDEMLAIMRETGGPLAFATGGALPTATPVAVLPGEVVRAPRACDGEITRGPNKGTPRRGTKAGYDAHRRAGEEPCGECADWKG